MENNDQVSSIIARNIAFYRKQKGMTQAELAEQIAYSDKSVSKWERGDGLPDILVMIKLAETFGVTLNDLVSEKAEPIKPKTKPFRVRLLIPAISIGLVYLVVSIVFFILRISVPQLERTWLVFLYGLPISCIVLTVFMNLWWNVYLRFISVSALIWSITLCVFFTIPDVDGIIYIFIIAGILQILTLLWYLLFGKPRHHS